jgi:hypothetical protein
MELPQYTSFVYLVYFTSQRPSTGHSPEHMAEGEKVDPFQ